jgi:predicted RNA-binding protein associated with RNAse of E/G family
MIAIRGLVSDRVRFVQSVIVEHDTVDESALLLLPGAQCAYPEWYLRKKDDSPLHRSRWVEALKKQWSLQTVAWRTNRFLMVTSPGKFYSVYLIWDHATDRFVCYYVNFQVPLTRSRCGFDTYDLELDIVVEPNGQWQMKDEAAFGEGIRMGVIRREWADAIAKEKEIVIADIESRDYPFDDYWRDYAVDPSWKPPSLPVGWDRPG